MSHDTQGTEKKLIDFNEARAQKLDEKRRKTERIFFKHLLSVYTVAGASEMTPVEVVDISAEGISFQVPYRPNAPWPKDSKDIPIRLYFSQDTYLEIIVTVQNSRPAIDQNGSYTRYGCKVDQTTASYEAYQQFTRFMELYAENSHKDLGDVSVFYL